MKARDSDFSVGSWNSLTKQYSTYFSEGGICTITKEEFYKLATAATLEAKITGGKLSQTYEKDDIPGSFIINLKQFYERQVKGFKDTISRYTEYIVEAFSCEEI